MKALVLCGGSGTRLRPLSHSMPKQLIPVANQPVLVRVMGNLLELGITDVGVIVGDRRAEIEEVLGDGSSLGVRVTYLRQDAPLGLAHCVRLARDFLGDEDFVLYLGDTVLTDGITDLAAEFHATRPAAQLVVQKVADPRAFGVAETTEDGRVTGLVEKPQHPRTDLAVVGVYFLTSAIHRAVDAIRPSARGELEITDAIQWLVDQGLEVRASVYSGFWRDTGKVEEVLDCNRELLNSLTPEVVGEVDADSVLTGPVVVEPGARVVRSTITGPAIVGAGTLVTDSSIGPYTSIGAGCLLDTAGISDSIMLAGSSVCQVREVRGSVIGRGASVLTGMAQHRLVVGDHTRVEFAA
ncbi:glucose-1-phosphate thymidylyltransferase [Streptomyces durbertensis]|uniref:Glucose-1-phosphate thymidylyltransferase n=1 Tax=Streptomyces durbertensis TaxID=2448886 RepID=A0ABR6EAC2_9ACTN|nr:glucose-1-phosphate thymidylyltransferase [Streptomyces durbertensis]MBB1242198.1 glucose-1-phosphate thymidylyltransferase [Streptomyces durbertensis]